MVVLSEADDGVSQVVNVIMLVAIAAGLSVGVFVVVSSFVDEPIDRTPEIGILADARGGTIQIVQAQWVEGPLLWEDLTVSGCDAPGYTGVVSGGQELSNCGDLVRIFHGPSNTLVVEYRS